MTIISDLLHAGVAPDLVARVADAIEAARSEGVDMSLRAMRSEGAERQARYRERRRNVTSDVKGDVTNDVTSNVTPSRARAFSIGEEVDITPLGSLRSPTLPKGSDAPKGKLGKRLPEDWQAAEAERAFGRNLGLSDAQIDEEQGQFKDFWRGVPGQRGHKLDWPATFRNRLRDVAGRMQLRKSSNGKGNLVDAGRKLVERLDKQFAHLDDVRPKDSGPASDPAVRLLPGFGSQRS
jgi:hypothetical protein